ncbi:MAG: hypothetical protein ABIW79_06270 [Gemmatimonas sp.]
MNRLELLRRDRSAPVAFAAMVKVLFATTLLSSAPACTPHQPALADFVTEASSGERVRVLELYSGVTATIVAPARLDTRQRVDLIVYALPNGNSTPETMGRTGADGASWRYDIQNIAAQTRAIRANGLPQAIVAYVEADSRSWPEWRRTRGYEKANARIVTIMDQLRAAIGDVPQLHVTLTAHSGGGSFIWGFIEGQAALPSWVERIAFLDANYSFEPRHGEKLAEWLHRSAGNALVVLAYDDRDITLDGKKVVSDSGGTWRATRRMIDNLGPLFPLTTETLGDFIRYRHPQVELLMHPNPHNRILHTEMMGEMNGYMHALLARRPAYERGVTVLKSSRAYEKFMRGAVSLPAPSPPAIPARAPGAMTGTAFIASIATLVRDEREAAIRRELFTGNIPSFLRTLRAVAVTATGSDSVKRMISYDVMPDYLSIGSDDDFVRMPMSPHTAQAFLDAFGFVLPTRKMVNDIWAAAPTHLEPRPLTQEREASLTFLQHNGITEAQLAGVKRPAFVAGSKKDVGVSNKLQERPDRVAIYGWHYVTGTPIQPLYTGHVDWYVDYSHGIRPVRRTMLLDGTRVSFEKIVGDSTLALLLSDEGPVRVPRYDK